MQRSEIVFRDSNGKPTTGRPGVARLESAPASKKSAKKDGQEITIHAPRIMMITLLFKSVGPGLLQNRMREEVIERIEEKEQGKAPKPQGPRDPQAEFLGSLHRIPGTKLFGIPAAAFQRAMEATTRVIKGLKKARISGGITVLGTHGDLIAIQGQPPTLHRQIGTNPTTRMARVIYRGWFRQWSCRVTIRYNESIISGPEIVNIAAYAGSSIGVGSWRKERGGAYGLWDVSNAS